MKIVIFTLGCKVNQYESEALASLLEESGHIVSFSLEKADIYILNTCAVTNEAERKSRQMIAKFNSLNPNAKILVCGCSVQHDAEKFRHLKNVTFLSGVAGKSLLLSSLNKKGTNLMKLPTVFEENMPLSKFSKVRAYVKIQDGCNNFCSYCLIPYLRGRSRSRNIVNILKEVENFSKNAKEIVLTGIDISDFSVEGENAVLKLLKLLEDFPVRVRLGSLEERLITPSFVKELSDLSNFCPHFHLSLQSGSDSVLKRMNRHYTSEKFLSAVKLIRKYFVHPAITTDVIVGFPGETDKEFLETYKFCKKVKFADMHIFPYSLRSGTVASKMKQTDGIKIKERTAKMLKLATSLKKKYLRGEWGRTRQLLVEEVKEGKSYGYTENYVKCVLPYACQPNTYQKIKLQSKNIVVD